MIPMFCACPPQIADLQTEIERKKLDIDEYSDRIAQLGHKEQSAREEVETQRSGLQGCNSIDLFSSQKPVPIHI